MTPVPDYVAGARALLASSDCTINGEPAVVVRIAELNDLVARVHRAEAAALPEPAAILSVVETAIGDQLTDGARAEALDGIRRVLAASRTTPDNPVTSGDAADNCGARIAYRIRAELVCCHIYDRVNDDRELTIRQAMDSRDWHDLCYWGEAAARIAEGRCPGYETTPNVCRCGCEGCKHNCGAHQEAAVAASATAGRATVTVTVTAPDQDNADRWAGTIRDLVQAEHGHHMRLDITVGSGEAGR